MPRPPVRVAVATLLAGWAALQSGCTGPEPPAAPPVAAGPSAAEAPAAGRRYPLAGVVRGVDADSGVVTIRHEEIPGFMKAMTMPFDLDDRALLEELRPGDEVEGTLVVEGDASRLIDLAITRPATGPTLTLDLSGGPPRLRPAAARLEPGQLVPDFTVTTQAGERLALSDLRGKVVLLTFIYTRCPLPDFCPALDRKFAAVADRLSSVPGRAEQIRLLSVSFDPEHDTPATLAEHAAIQGARPPLWTFAVAEHDELRKVAEPLGLMYGPTKDEIVHNRCIAVIGPDGRLAELYTDGPARDVSPTDLVKAAYAKMPESGG